MLVDIPFDTVRNLVYAAIMCAVCHVCTVGDMLALSLSARQVIMPYGDSHMRPIVYLWSLFFGDTVLIWVLMSGVLTCHDERGTPRLNSYARFSGQKHLHSYPSFGLFERLRFRHRLCCNLEDGVTDHSHAK